jgi:hypothetical protein
MNSSNDEGTVLGLVIDFSVAFCHEASEASSQGDLTIDEFSTRISLPLKGKPGAYGATRRRRRRHGFSAQFRERMAMIQVNHTVNEREHGGGELSMGEA